MSSRPDSDPPGKETASPPEALVRSLIENLGQLFDLSTAIGERTLGEAVEERLRSLRTAEPPEWGTPGDITQVARLEAGPLDFYYRPHLLSDMDPALRLGHLLQFDLLPRRLPAGSPLRVAAVLESYCHLSGDLLGWRQEDDEIFLWVADVSGHGIRAGLAAAVLYFLVDSFGPGQEPAVFARELNRKMLAARNPADQRMLFVTAFWLRFHVDGRGIYASTGHPPMQLRRASGEVEQLAATGMPLGMLPDQDFRQVDFVLSPGDSLCLFTDGLVEALDPEGEEFGRQRLVEVLRRPAGGALGAAHAVYRALRAHRDTTLLDDDLTFLLAEPSVAGD